MNCLSLMICFFVVRVRQHIFLDPNAKDPLNQEAADELKNNRELFKRNVRTSMGGGKLLNKAKQEVTYSKVLP